MKIHNFMLSVGLVVGLMFVAPASFAWNSTPLPPTPQWGACTTQGNCVCDSAHRSPYCQPGSTSTNTNTNTNTNNNSNSQGQQQGQGQAQGQSQSSTSKATGGSVEDSGNSANFNSLRGGNSTSRSSSGGNKTRSSADNSANGNSAVTVDTGSHASNSGNDNSRTTFEPSVVPSTPSSFLAAGSMMSEMTACIPKVTKVTVPINGTYMGFITNPKIDLGTTDTVMPASFAGAPDYYDDWTDSNHVTHVMGNQLYIVSGMPGVSGGRNLAIGGFGSNGGGGQVGGGSSSSMQRIVQTILILPCELGTRHKNVTYQEVPAKNIRQ